MCQPPQCPPPGPGCKKSTLQDRHSCCPQFICGKFYKLPRNEKLFTSDYLSIAETAEAPTVVLDRMDITSNPQDIITVADRVATPDPFRDVIRTEPAPDLQSLIGDIMPYLARHSTTQQMTPKSEMTTESSKNISTTTTESEFSLNKVLELLLYGEATTQKLNNTNDNSTNIEKQTTVSSTASEILHQSSKEIINSNVNHSNNNQVSAGVGLLKLAGCNIYGRMYRVGRIISELSGPCLECKCTEGVVQCTPLKC